MGAAMQLSDRIGSRIKLQDLHVLMTVVQAGSMGKAAQRLNTTQPNISRSIGELEHALGVRLLDRHRQGVEPTEYGRVLLDCGVAVFDDLRQGVKNIAFLANPTAGEVRIGSTPFLAASFVSALIDRLSRRYPRITFHLVTGYMETLHRELSERNLDLLIVRSSGPLADGWILNLCLTTPTSSSPAPKTHGSGGAASNSPSWRTNCGCCRRREA